MVIHSSIFAWRIPMDRGAWWATVHRVVQSRIRVKQLSMRVHLRLSLSFFFKVITYLSVEGLSCGMWDLVL